MFAKVKEFFKNKEKLKELLVIILIFILAFAARAHLMKYELLFGFDSYFHTRVIGYIVKDFKLPEKDPLGYYYRDDVGFGKEFNAFIFWYTSAILYKIFTLFAPYKKELLIWVAKILPALYGAIICVLMYFLGKVAFNKRVGLLMGFFAGLVPSFVYRTLSGFLEEDSFGFIWMILAFIFIIKASKLKWPDKKIFIYAVLAGLSAVAMLFSWKMYLIIPALMLIYVPLQLIVLWWHQAKKEEYFKFISIIGILLLILVPMALLNDPRFVPVLGSYVGKYVPISQENIQRLTATSSTSFVGEESPGKHYFGIKYNALILLAIAGFFVYAYRLYTKPNNFDALGFSWLLLCFIMAWTKLKFTYVFGLPIAAASAVVLNQFIDFSKNMGKLEKGFIATVLVFFCLLAVGSASIFVTQKVPHIELNTGWKEALYWMEKNMDSNKTRLFNWWDEGHWLTLIAEKKVTTDNRNQFPEPNQDFARFLFAEDENAALEILKLYKPYPTHVVIDIDYVNQLGSFLAYAKMSKAFNPKNTNYIANYAPCKKNVNKLTKEVSYVCGGNTFDEKTYLAFPQKWQKSPVLVQHGIPLFIYRDPTTGGLYIFNALANKTMLAKLVTNAELKHFKQIYAHKQVRIFEVSYEN